MPRVRSLVLFDPQRGVERPEVAVSEEHVAKHPGSTGRNSRTFYSRFVMPAIYTARSVDWMRTFDPLSFREVETSLKLKHIIEGLHLPPLRHGTEGGVF